MTTQSRGAKPYNISAFSHTKLTESDVNGISENVTVL